MSLDVGKLWIKTKEDEVGNQETQTERNDLTSSDTRSKPEKWTVKLHIGLMVGLMLTTFAAFQ